MTSLNLNATFGNYLSSIDLGNYSALNVLQERLDDYYHNPRYHTEWIVNRNANWELETHRAQIKMCTYIPVGSRVLEVGCGDGRAKIEIEKWASPKTYVGLDINPDLWTGSDGFTAARANEIPFLPDSFDVVLSMFVIEHLVYPAQFLDEAWRIIRPGGVFLLLAPDFTYHPMPSERVGDSYDSGRVKLRQGKYRDALMTLYDSRIRISFLRWIRLKRWLQMKKYNFLIYMDPRCFHLPTFTPDCDAVYPVAPLEIINYMGEKTHFSGSELFYRDQSIFGLLVKK